MGRGIRLPLPTRVPDAESARILFLEETPAEHEPTGGVELRSIPRPGQRTGLALVAGGRVQPLDGPRGSRIVFDSGVDLTMIGLDVCHRTTFDRDGAAAVRGSGTPLATFVADTSESWIAVLSSALDQSTAMLPEGPHRPVAERRVAAATVRGCER